MSRPDGAEGGGLIGYFVRHRTAANLLVLVLVAFGLVGALEMRRQRMPDVELASIGVDVRWRGAGAEQMDRAVLSLIEPAMRELTGLERTVGMAWNNRARLTLEFAPGADLDRAMAEVQAALDRVTGLPSGADPPEITRRSIREVVAGFVLHGPVSDERLHLYAEELATRFSRAGMTSVRIGGTPELAVEVRVPEAALLRHGLTLRDVAAAVRDAVASDPAGYADGGAVRLSVGGERRTAEALADLPLRRDAGEGPDLRLGDVASVLPRDQSRGARHYVDGDPAIIVWLDRGPGDDALDLLEGARAIVAAHAPSLPAGVEITEALVRADEVEGRLALLLDNAAFGLLLVLALLFLFLSSRAAFWVAAGIPVALLGALGAMWLTGFTINLFSLFALIMMLGIVVDDAIVVGEHADALARRGLPPALAAERAARRMAGPVFAASVTTAIAFGSILAIGGPFGAMVEDIPLTVGLVLLASLLECFLILPAHMAHAAAPGRGRLRRAIDAPSRVVDRGFVAFRERAFRPAMGAAVRLRHPLLGLAIMLLLGAVGKVATGDLPWRFWNGPESNVFRGYVAMLDSAEREDTYAQVMAMEAAVREVGAEYAVETGANPIKSIIAGVGHTLGGRGLAIAEDKPRELVGGLLVELVREGERPMRVSDFVKRVSERVERLPTAEAATFRTDRVGPAGDALSARFSGSDPAALKAAAEALKAAVAGIPEIVGVEDTLAYGRDELTLELSPLGRALGLTPEALAAQLDGRFALIRAVETVEAGRDLVVFVGLPREETTADHRRRAMIALPAGGHAPLSVLTVADARPGFAGYRRENGRLVVSVNGDVATEDAARAAEIDRALRERIVPEIAARHGVDWSLAGLAEQERRFLADARFGAILGMIGIYAALAWVFGSWTRPVAVLLVAPFGFVGVVWGHIWMDEPLSMISVVGMLGMIGIIVNDSIVLVAAADEEARRRARIPAVVEAVCGRLRPVLLTTLTTVLGLAPLLFDPSEEAASLRPSVITLVFGLGFGFVLVLMVTPALLLLQHDVGAALASLRRLPRHLLRRRRGLGGAP